MRRWIWGSIVLLLLLCTLPLHALAADSAEAELAVTIDGGGTAKMIAQVNCPLPAQSTITLKHGETGHFTIEFTEPGTYCYLITAENSEGKHLYPAQYSAEITVAVNEDGTLYTVTVLTGEGSEKKADTAAFSSKETPTRPPETTKVPPTTKKTPPTPHTGDDSGLDWYLLLAVGAAAGLFLLALLYARETKKLIEN